MAAPAAAPPNTSTDAKDERRRHLREQMRQFYGTTGHRAEAAQRTPGVAPELSLDSEFFSVGRYTTELLRRESLRGLVEADTELLRTMRTLNGELQELVYQNYSKFISATDTIREMKDNVGMMDVKLCSLAEKVKKVDDLSGQLHDEMHIHRERISRTITVNRQLKKVQFLLQLPDMMRQMLQQHHHHVAVKYWVAGDGFLAKHAAMPKIAQIHSECRTLAKQLYHDMEMAMCETELDDPEAMEIIRRHVESLRLLRATSLATCLPSTGDLDGAIRRALMQRVSGSFCTSVAALHRNLAAASSASASASMHITNTSAVGGGATAATTTTTSSSSGSTRGAEREAALMARITVAEVLAQLKSACALLAQHSRKVYSLLSDAPSEAEAATQCVAAEVLPVLRDLLHPIMMQLVELYTASLWSVAGDAAAAADATQQQQHQPQPPAPTSVVAELFTPLHHALLTQLKSMATTLKSIAALYLSPADVRAHDASVDQGVAEVMMNLAQRLRAQASRCAPSSSSSMEVCEGEAIFMMMYAAAATLLAEVVIAGVRSANVLNVESVMDATQKQMRNTAHDLHHRGVVLLGQIYAGELRRSVAFNPAATSSSSALTMAAVVPDDVVAVLQRWGHVMEELRALPPPQPLPYPRTTSTTTTTTSTSSPTNNSSMMRGGRGTSSIVVRHARNDEDALQQNVERIFANVPEVLTTSPEYGDERSTVGGVAAYVMKALVDHVRRTPRVWAVADFQRAHLCATMLLRWTLMQPIVAVRREVAVAPWSEVHVKVLQLLADELGVGAQERCTAGVVAPPLIPPVVDAAVEAGMSSAGALPTTSAPAVGAQQHGEMNEMEE